MIAIVEDDETIANLEQYALAANGMRAKIFYNGHDFFRSLETSLPDMLILDVMLPDMDGYEILKRFRAKKETHLIPVMMVTANGGEMNIVQGLDCGADDYLAKPFGILEFISRTKALLRRVRKYTPEQSANCETLTFQSISMNLARHQVTVNGNAVELTLKEYELLKMLMQSPETALRREAIMNQVWDMDISLESRTLDMHMRTLRQKLGEAGTYIQTLRKIGFILTEGRS